MMRRLLLLLLLVWMPIQVAAYPALALRCDAEHGTLLAGGAAHDEHVGHEHHGGGDGRDADHDDSNVAFAHFCCHHFFALPVTLAGNPSDRAAFPAADPAPPLLSIIPERQQRPPRA